VPPTRDRRTGCPDTRRDRPDTPNRAICPLQYGHAKPPGLYTESIRSSAARRSGYAQRQRLVCGRSAHSAARCVFT
jgi:hypothetical protein